MNFQNVLSSSKDLFALLRDFFLFLLPLLLVGCPKQLNERLVNAGFEEGSVLGFKWKSGLDHLNSSLKDALTSNNLLKIQNDSLSSLLSQLKPNVTTPELRNQIRNLETRNAALDAAATRMQDAARTTLAANADLISKAQLAVSSNGDLWGVVFGADADSAGARDEKRKAMGPKYGVPRVAIFYRQGYYRSVALADSRDEAESILPKARDYQRATRTPDAYIVSMSTWCPQTKDRGICKECTGK